MNTQKITHKWRGLMTLWAVMLVTFVLLGGITGLKHGLIDPDEGRYAEISREMLESGDFVTPRLNYVTYFEKPALHYWLTATAFKILGENEPAARAVPVILGLGGVVLTFMLTRKMTGSKNNVRRGQPNMSNIANVTHVTVLTEMNATSTGFLAATILSSSILWYAMSHINITDMTLTFFFTLAMAAYYSWHTSGAQKISWLLIFYASMALAVLTKGLIGVVLPGGIALLHRIATVSLVAQSECERAGIGSLGQSVRQKVSTKSESKVHRVLKLFSPLGIALFFVIILPWFVLVCRENPDFFQFFFIHEHFLRYTTTIHERWEPIWFFVPVMLGALVPWTGLLLDAFQAARGQWGVLRHSDSLFLTLWALLPFVFFSLSGAKLVPYILPCLPPISILMGVAFEVMMSQHSRWNVLRFVVISTLVLVPLVIAGIWYPKLHPEVPESLTRPLVIVLSVFWLTSFGLFWKCKIIAPVLCLLALAVPLSSSHAFNYFAGLHSQREIAAMIQERIRDDDKIVAWRELMQGLAFYMQRRVIIAGTFNELEFGANALLPEDVNKNNNGCTPGEIERASWFMDSKALRRLWNGPNRVFLVTRRKHIPNIAKELGHEPVRLGETAGEILCANF